MSLQRFTAIRSECYGNVFFKIMIFNVCCLYLGCQMVTFQTKNPILGKFCRVLQWNMLAYFMAVWYTLQPFGIFCGHLLYLIVIPYTFPVLVCCAKKNLATLVCTVCTCHRNHTSRIRIV
jgi:hypothetical protein